MPVKPKVAMIASVGLGDGAVYLIVANNLARNGFDVTFYSNPISHLDRWLPAMTVKPYPALEACDEELSAYDVVLADSISIVGKPHYGPGQFREQAEKYIFLGVGMVDKELRMDHTERLKSKLDPEVFEKCRKLASCAGEIRFQNGDRNMTMVKSAVVFCENVLGLENVEASCGYVPPDSALKYRSNSKRVLLHPFSSHPKRSWTLKKYIKLAEKLQSNGWEPVFVATVEEQKRLKAVGCPFSSPVFPGIDELATYMYESAILIGNDSGPVNLSSSLGIPTISIGCRGKNHRWRPDWTDGIVVRPWLNLKLNGKRVWQPFLAVKKVYSAFETLAERNPVH